MSLNWNLEAIKDHKQVCWIGDDDDAHMNPVTEVLIWGTMAVGLGSITDKNVDEFAARFRIMEKVHGSFLVKGKGKPWLLTDEDFIAHIGLVCNVSNETRAKWAGRIFTNKQTSITEQLARAFRYDRSKVAA